MLIVEVTDTAVRTDIAEVMDTGAHTTMAADIMGTTMVAFTAVIIMVIMVTMVPAFALALVGDIHTSVYTLGHYHLAVIPFIGAHTLIITTEGLFTDHIMMDIKW